MDPAAERDDFEVALTDCIDALEGDAGSVGCDSSDELERVLARHPEHAERLRARLESLRRLGLLRADEAGVPAAIGRYRILRALGRGGMATVYLARDPRDGTLVALKASAAPLDGSGRARARFEREIRALGGLRHPGLVPVLDSGESDGRPYFTMEYVRGSTLAEVVAALRRSGRPIGELRAADVLALLPAVDLVDAPATPVTGSYFELVTRVVQQVALALDHLHGRGVLHRDIKPSNVLLRPDGRAALFDLGLAHVEDQPQLTRSGDFAGTPYYVSPEQVRDGPRALDPRSDVYSLGVTLYELLTLRRPFEGRSTAEVLRAIADDEPPLPRHSNPLVPRGLETICLTAVERDPARRYGSARELAEDLQRFRDFLPVRARPIGGLRRSWRFVRRHPARALALGLAALISIGLPAGLLLANRAIREQRDLAAEHAALARRQVQRSERQVDFLIELFDSSGGGLAEEALDARTVLDRSAERIETQFESDPLALAALLEATGRVYAELGSRGRAVYQLDRALATLKRELGEGHPESAGVLAALAQVHLEGGEAEDALALAGSARRAFAAAGEAGCTEDLRSGSTLADALVALGRPSEAHEVLDELRALAGEDERTSIEGRLARLLRLEGQLEEAHERYRAAERSCARAVDPDVLALAGLLEERAELSAELDRPDVAVELEGRAERLRSAWQRARTQRGPEEELALEAALVHFDLLPPTIEEYDRRFQEGITALQSGRLRAAIELFEHCLDRRPGRAACAYNLACAHALLGESAAALDWFERACELGIGALDVHFASMRRDPDLESIRGEPRFEGALDRVRKQRERLATRAERPAFTPGGEAGGSSAPLLVVLHAHGATPERASGGPVAEAARARGFAVFAPAAPLFAGEGFAWFNDVRDLSRHPGQLALRLADEIERCVAREGLDPERVLLLGEGAGATLAFDLALRAPGRFSAVVLLGGTLHPVVADDRVRRSAALGLEVHLILGQGAGLVRSDASALARHAERARDWLARRGIRHRVLLEEPSPAALLAALPERAALGRAP